MGRLTVIEAQAAFLKELARTGRRTKSARAAGVSNHFIKKWRAEYPDFAASYDEAMDEYRESLQAEIHRRGVEGVLEPVFYQGMQVGEVRKYSDTLLILEAKRHIPAYRDHTRHDVNVTGGVLVVGPQAPTNEEWEKRYS